VAVGATLLADASMPGPSFAPSLWVARVVAPNLEVGVRAVGPAFAPSLTAAQGDVRVRRELATVGLTYSLPWRLFAPFATLGAGVHHVQIDGDARKPNASEQGDAWSAIVDARLGVTANLSRRFALVVEGGALVALPRPVIEVLDTKVAGIGRPTFVATTAALVRF
jgi:hypothetical protein